MNHNQPHGTATRPRRAPAGRSRRMRLVLVLVVAVVGLLAQACTRHNDDKTSDPAPGGTPVPTLPAVPPCPTSTADSSPDGTTGGVPGGGTGGVPGGPGQPPGGLPDGPGVSGGGTVSPFGSTFPDLPAPPAARHGGGAAVVELARPDPDPPGNDGAGSATPNGAPPCHSGYPTPPTLPASGGDSPSPTPTEPTGPPVCGPAGPVRPCAE